MFYSKEEVELTLKLYSIAKVHLNELENRNLNCSCHDQVDILYFHYYFIVHTVDKWKNKLYPDELEIIDLRVFQKKAYDNISIRLGYANHSSVIKKYKHIINKICEYGERI